MFAGCTVIVTGGGGDVGQAVCLQVAQQGATRVIAVDLRRAALDVLEARFAAKAADACAAVPEVVCIVADLTDKEVVETALYASDVLGPVPHRPVHALIHCAGGAVDQLAEEPPVFPSLADFRASYRLNVETALNCIHVCLPALLKGAAGLGDTDPVPFREPGEDPTPPSFPDGEEFLHSAGIVLVSSVNAVSGGMILLLSPSLCGPVFSQHV